VLSRQVQLVAYPPGEIRADHFRVVEVETPAPGPGDVLVRNTWTSVDPGMRLRLVESAPAGYFAPFALKAPLDGIMPLGGVGLTAYAGLLHAAELREGDVVWVSAAAGAVGSLAAQIAKLRGHRVIGSAGSPAKTAFLREELGLDAAFDYHGCHS
jgi:NADPH-dependent curcumin reductase CurA